jgi:hypothetical protein
LYVSLGYEVDMTDLLLSVYVPQEYGSPRPEFVTMAHLSSVKRSAKKVFERYKTRLPDVPKIPLVEATAVPAKRLFVPQEIKAGQKVKSEPIFLQTGSDEVYSFAVDLSSLNENIVFSVILSNSNDPLGRQPDTILVRNGVTATAARKLANQEIQWFYHGKPMNDGDMRLHVTVGRDQMTFAYYDDTGSHLYVHGDCPVSLLSADHIGDVRDTPFHIYIHTRDKVSQRQDPVTISVLEIDGKGYIHEPVNEKEHSDFDSKLIEPLETKLKHNPESTVRDQELFSEIATISLG